MIAKSTEVELFSEANDSHNNTLIDSIQETVRRARFHKWSSRGENYQISESAKTTKYLSAMFDFCINVEIRYWNMCAIFYLSEFWRYFANEKNIKFKVTAIFSELFIDHNVQTPCRSRIAHQLEFFIDFIGFERALGF